MLKISRLIDGYRKSSLVLAAGIFNLDVGPIDTNNPNGVPDLFALNIVKLIGAIAIPLAVVAIIYSSYILITSSGEPAAIERAKKNITYLVTGIALILFARILFNFVANFFN